MTRDELISLGMTPELARATQAYLKCSLPRPPRYADATALINNEGAMNGWTNAADAIGALAAPMKDEKQEELPLYSEPARK